MRDLEQELESSTQIRYLCESNIFAQNLYAALCNMRWTPSLTEEPWSCSWRYAGGIVANLRDKNEDYMDWYCSGITQDEDGYVPEGHVTPFVEEVLNSMGWSKSPYPES